MVLFTTILAGILSTFIMIMFLEFVTRSRLANADMVRAIGSIVTKSYDKSLVPGLIIQFGFGVVFSFVYFGILSYFNSSIGLNGVLGGGLIGLFHGIVVGFVGVAAVAEHHPLERFRIAGFMVSTAHVFGHVVYGISLGLIFQLTGIRIITGG